MPDLEHPYRMPLADLYQHLAATREGLTSEEAAKRLAKYGPNQLPSQAGPAWWQIGLRQFRSPLIYILLVAAVVSLFLRHTTDAVFIGAVLLLNATIGGYQEWRAEQSSRALQKLLNIRAAVLRDGEVCEEDAKALVPGDIVMLESGNRVPADLRLIGSHSLEVDESLLTGESLAVVKCPQWIKEDSVPIGDRLNMTHAGSMIVRGRASGLVVATGTQTLVGQLALDVSTASHGSPPLIQRMERFARAIAVMASLAAICVGLAGFMLRGYPAAEMFMLAVAVAVAGIPEGLPVALTVALSIATSRMAKRGVIVRRLVAVEGLGSCTLIASDKTGTLTCNELTVRQITLASKQGFEVTGQGFEPHGQILSKAKQLVETGSEDLRLLMTIAALCNEGDLFQKNAHWLWHGDPTDVALLTMAHKAGFIRSQLLRNHPQVGLIPFEPDLQYAASFHQNPQGVSVYVKGAIERVLDLCRAKLTDSQYEDLYGLAGVMAEDGFRVLALAYGERPSDFKAEQFSAEATDLVFAGFVGMIDPLRAEVPAALEACQHAGVKVWMITGDHPVTALAIAKTLGLATRPEQVINGKQIQGKSELEILEIIKDRTVFARIAPRQKLEIVNAARKAGEFVVVTGDGVNDAPALRSANIGVAMGKSGTDIAREAADLVISDDNFATIVSGIEEGRVAYDNIRKVIYLLISTGAAEIALIALAVVTGLPLPLTAVQILWLNLVTNGIQDVALAFEPSEGDVLSRKPRLPKEKIFNRLMIERTIIAAAVMALVGYSLFWWLTVKTGWHDSEARNALLLLMVLFENVHIGNCRSETKSALALSVFSSPILLLGALSAFGIHVLAMHVPFMQALLQVQPVSFSMWMLLIGLAMTILVAMELHKLSIKR